MMGADALKVGLDKLEPSVAAFGGTFKRNNVCDKYKVMIGGGPTSRAFADEIGADAWAETADEAVTLCDKQMPVSAFNRCCKD